MSFQLPISLVHWNWCKDNKRFSINQHGVWINSNYCVTKQGINGAFKQNCI